MIKKIILFLALLLFSMARADVGDVYLCEIGQSAWMNKNTVLKNPKMAITNERFQFQWFTSEIKFIKIAVEEADFITADRVSIKNASEFDFFAADNNVMVHFDDSTGRMFITVQTFENIASAMAMCERF